MPSWKANRRIPGDNPWSGHSRILVGSYLKSLTALAIVCCFSASLVSLQRRLLAEDSSLSSLLSFQDDNSFLPHPTPTQGTVHGNDDRDTNYTTLEAAAVNFMLRTDNTTLLALEPYQSMQSFLQQYPDTAGSRFIRLIQKELHGRPEWEPQRQLFCERVLPLCIGGYHNTNGRSTVPPSASMEQTYKYYSTQEHNFHVPLLPKIDATSVYRVRRFRQTDHILHNLGSTKACLPLLLAGASIDTSGVVVELGPFAGFSSKCAAYGVLMAMNLTSSTSLDKNNDASSTTRLVSYDVFAGDVNYLSIAKYAPWVKEVYPNFTEEDSTFVKLWEDTVQDIYPGARAEQQYIDSNVLNDDTLQQRFGTNLSPQVLIVDTVKTSKLLHHQLGGLSLQVGTVIFLMDFQRSKDLVQQIYGCFRSNFLLPIYISWNSEHMAFVVTRTFNVNDPEVFKCYRRHAAIDFSKPSYDQKVMEARMKQDLTFLSGLTTDPKIHEQYQDGLRDKMWQTMKQILDHQDVWTWKVLQGLGHDNNDQY
jgi:hypothetical protein